MSGNPLWHGEPSGPAFAALVRERAQMLGLDATVEVRAYTDSTGVYAVDVEWGGEHAGDMELEVSDRSPGVRIMYPSAEDVETAAQAWTTSNFLPTARRPEWL